MIDATAPITDPLEHERSRARRAWCISGGAVAVAGLWACWPLGGADQPSPVPSAAPTGVELLTSPLELSAFEAPVATFRPWPVVAEANRGAASSEMTTIPKPPTLRVLAVITGSRGGEPVRRAMVFDVASQSLVELAEGQSINQERVVAITDRGVTLRRGDQERVVEIDRTSAQVDAKGAP